MLKTLLKLGRELSEGRTPWDDIIDVPNLPVKNNNGEKITYFAINLIFDLDEASIKLEKSAELSFDKNAEYSPHGLKYVKVKPGREKAFYATVEEKKLNQIPKTFFGTPKDGEFPEKSEFMEAIEKVNSSLKETRLYLVLKEIQHLGGNFYDLFMKEGDLTKNIKKQLNLVKNEEIGLVFTSVKSTKLNLTCLTPVNQLEGFDKFIEDKQEQNKVSKEGLDYVSGTITKQGEIAEFERTLNINKLFVQTTKNYASHFTSKGFAANYQIDQNSKIKLERASKFLLEKSKVTIGGIQHTIIPEFFQNPEKGIEKTIPEIREQSELLFGLPELNKTVKKTEAEIKQQNKNSFFWFNFIAYEGNEKSFKIINQIKDVSKFHFLNTAKSFSIVHQILKPWLGSRIVFNLQQVYYLIPVRLKTKKGGSYLNKRHEALNLTKDILEQRSIRIEQLFDYFKHLVLCDRFRRHEMFTNMKNRPSRLQDTSKQFNFDFALKDATFKYLALIKSLQNLGLLTKNDIIMKDQSGIQTKEIGPKVEDFFEKMGWSDEPNKIALFFLGRALDTISKAQYEQNHKSKPVLGKLNYNGMDKGAILRLSRELWEKANQYSNLSYKSYPNYFFNQAEGNLKRFQSLFDYDHWEDQDIREEEALFYILTGYSFGIRQAQEPEEETTEQ